MKFWLLKTEPSTFSIDDLKSMPNGTDHWDGVRNYQARNMIRDEMKKGDLAFIYHSNCPEPGIVGIATISREAYPDFTAWDLKERYFDPRSDPTSPRWFMVDVKYERKLKRTITLLELRTHPELNEMPLLQKGNRLSVMPVNEAQWRFILDLE